MMPFAIMKIQTDMTIIGPDKIFPPISIVAHDNNLTGMSLIKSKLNWRWISKLQNRLAVRRLVLAHIDNLSLRFEEQFSGQTLGKIRV